MLRSNDKACAKCNDAPAVKEEKYCKACRKAVLAELRASGYLTPVQHHRPISEHFGRPSISSRVIGGAASFDTDDSE